MFYKKIERNRNTFDKKLSQKIYNCIAKYILHNRANIITNINNVKKKWKDIAKMSQIL